MKTSNRRNKKVKIFIRDNKKCYICWKSLSLREVTLDHVIPKCDNGKTYWDNLRCCCDTCNNMKSVADSFIANKRASSLKSFLKVYSYFYKKVMERYNVE